MSLMYLICFVDHISYKYCLHSQNKLINERETEKQRIVNFDGKWRPGWLYGDQGVRRPNYFTIYYRSTRFSMKKLCQSAGILLTFPRVQFYSAGTVSCGN